MSKLTVGLKTLGVVVATPVTTVLGTAAGGVVGLFGGAAAGLKNIVKYNDGGEFKLRHPVGMVWQALVSPVTVPVFAVVGTIGGAVVGGAAGFMAPTTIAVGSELLKDKGCAEAWREFKRDVLKLDNKKPVDNKKSESNYCNDERDRSSGGFSFGNIRNLMGGGKEHRFGSDSDNKKSTRKAARHDNNERHTGNFYY